MTLLDEEDESQVKKFRLHWLAGDVAEVEGKSIMDAMRRAGYGQGAIAALDYWEEIKEKE